uniref:Uncharacterized protein n=1 Tax=Solanum tuberosum TaxID=4113 RepID=M1DB65_SOLTU
MPSYDNWFCHGETLERLDNTEVNNQKQATVRGDDMRGMIHDAFGGCTEFIDSDINERDHEWFVPRLIKPRDIFDMGDENSVQFESSMQSDLTDLSLLETACVPENECDNWVRSGVDGIVIETDIHSLASTNGGEANAEGGNDIENESDS